MSRRTGFLASLVLTAIAFAPASAYAQRYLEDPGYNGEGMPYRDCSDPEDPGTGEEEEEGLSTSPATLEEAELPSGLTPEQVQNLAEEERRLQEREIEQLDDLLAGMPPDYPRRAEIMFRRAESYKALADADYLVARAVFNECINNWYQCTSDEECYEPMPDYAVATESYREVIRNHANYERTDEVVFRLGETLMKNDEGAEAVTFLTRLVNNYGDSGYVCDARILMGDYYFDNDLLIVARQHYDAVMELPNCNLYNYAIYKLAWVDINENLYEDAITRLQTVVDNLDRAQDQRLDFRQQALNDMLLAYAEIEDGWMLARDYYERHEGEDAMRRQLTRLGGLFEEQGKHDERVSLLSYFLQRYEYDEKVPQWAEEMLSSLTIMGGWDRFEEAARTFIVNLDPHGTWAIRNQGNERALSNARLLTESTLLQIINRNFQEAERLRTMPDIQHALYQEVAADYLDFFQRFPDSEEAYDNRFYYAELLYYKLANGGIWEDDYWLDRETFDTYLRQAGDQYRQVVEMDPDPEAEHAHDAAVGALQVYDDFMKREVPDVDSPLPPPDEFVWVEERPLGPASQDYVEIVAWFAELYPEDELIPAASWRAAALYLRNGHVAEAAERFETIIEHHPRHRFAQEAALAAFVCYNRVENWVKIESVARRLLEVCDEGESDICETERLQSAIAYAMNNQAEDLVEAGRSLEIGGDTDGALAQYLLAAEKRLALYREFPDSEWAPAALFNAAATYERARNIDEAITLYSEFLTRYPEHEFVADAMFTLGLIQDSQARFLEAAQWFERVDAYAAYENRLAAVYNAGRLREAMSQFDDAIRLYEHYIELSPESDEAKSLYFVMAEIEQERGNLDSAFDRYGAFLTAYPSDSVRRLIATSMQADIRMEQGRTDEAMTLYERVDNMYGAGELGFDAADLPTDWVTAPGGNFSDESQRVSVLPYASEARFWMAERDYQAARETNLTFREGRWRELADRLTLRGEAIVASQRTLYYVIKMGDAEWAVAASARLGQLYYDFYRDIFAIPAPDENELYDMGATDEQVDEFLTQYDEMVYNIGEPLSTKALAAFAAGRDIAAENGIYTDWHGVILREMNDIDRTWRLGDSEGLSGANSSDIFIATGYILDLAEKLRAFENFVPAPVVPAPDTGMPAPPPGP